jgi:hypothetical protein
MSSAIATRLCSQRVNRFSLAWPPFRQPWFVLVAAHADDEGVAVREGHGVLLSF